MTARRPKDMNSFYEFWNKDPDVEAPEGAVSAGDVERVIEQLCPLPEKLQEQLVGLEECRRDVALAIWKIRQVHRMTVRPAEVKKQLEKIAVVARKLRVETSKLPDDVVLQLRASTVLRNCGQLIEKSSALATRTKVPKRSGGAKLDAARKMVAARHAFSLCYLIEGIQSRTKDGPYVRLTELLFRVATGRRGSCDKACAEHFRELEEYGLFDDAMLRQWRREASLITAKK